MKLIVQIPCFNEAQTLAQTLNDIPPQLPGIDTIEVLVVDDGSTDDTAAVAWEHGADHVISHLHNRGLAASFQTGMQQALRLGADIIINTDGDNQYVGADMALLIEPILSCRADIVIGDRQVKNSAHFGTAKRLLQRAGSAVVSSLSGTNVPDAVSGFRAISRHAAVRLNILSRFSYTTEMIIQAGNRGLGIESVPVRTNPATRPPRLFKSLPGFIARQTVTMIRMYAMYRPMRFFMSLTAICVITGAIPVIRFLFFYFAGEGEGHVQSLLLGGSLLTIGFIFFVTALLADLTSQNRKLLESTLEHLRRLELEPSAPSAVARRAKDAEKKKPSSVVSQPSERQ